MTFKVHLGWDPSQINLPALVLHVGLGALMAGGLAAHWLWGRPRAPWCPKCGHHTELHAGRRCRVLRTRRLTIVENESVWRLEPPCPCR